MSDLVEFVDEVCGIYARSIFLPHAGTKVPQHSHNYDHASFVGSGSVRLIANGALVGDFKAGQLIEVKANTDHLFVALEPNTRIACLHHTASAEAAKKVPLAQDR